MAPTLAPVYNVSITLIDLDWNTSSMTLHFPASEAIATVEAFVVGTVIPAIQGVSDAVVKQWSITRQAIDLSAPADAPETSDVERKGVFSFRAADGSAYVVNVPSFLNSLVTDRTNLITTSDSLVQAFTDAMITGATGSVPSSYLGSDLIQLDHARKKHRSSNRG